VEGSSTGNVSVCLLRCHFVHNRQRTVQFRTAMKSVTAFCHHVHGLFMYTGARWSFGDPWPREGGGGEGLYIPRLCGTGRSEPLPRGSTVSLNESDDAILNLIYSAAGGHSTVWWCCERGGHCGWRLWHWACGVEGLQLPRQRRTGGRDRHGGLEDVVVSVVRQGV
jgi:hypothetical protein